MKVVKWVMKLAALVLIVCTGGWIGVLLYSLIVGDEENMVLNLLHDVLAPIDRALS